MERQLSSALNLCRRCRHDILALQLQFRKQLRQQGRKYHQRILVAATRSSFPSSLSSPTQVRSLFSSAKAPPDDDDSSREVTLARQHCERLLETHDYPSSLIRWLMPGYARDAFTVIRAFNIEVAMVADHTSSLTIGELRMGWWSKAIDRTFDSGTGSGGPPTNQPVTLLLRHVLRRTRLSKGFFKKVISAREQYLGNPPFPSLSSLETYAESTYSSLFYLTLESLLSQPSVELDHVASHAGKAAGIAAVLRGTPILAFPHPPATSHEAQGGMSPSAAVVLPLDVCASHNLRQEDIIRHAGKATGLKDAVFEIATRANDHLITAQTMYSNLAQKNGGTVDENTLTGFLPAVATALYLRRLQKADFDVFHPSLQRREWKLPWYLYRALKGKHIVPI